MSQLLTYLLILVCPLAMGVMMWVMMRGMDHGKQPDPRLAELESQVAELHSAVTRSRQPDEGEPANDASAIERV